jgi:hypothetical protein
MMTIPDAIDRAALKILWRHLGWFRALQIGLRITNRQRRGEPFGHLPEAVGFSEIGSRAQAGPAILLYEELKRLGRSDALDITSECISHGAGLFLGASIGRIDRARLASLDDEARRAWLEETTSRFPNATLTVDEASVDRVRFTVSQCRLHGLTVDVGYPELAPLFCRGDAAFFGGEGVKLERPGTLAEGAASCPFTLTFLDS